MNNIPPSVLSTIVPITDFILYDDSFNVLSAYGDNVKKNDMQMFLGLKRFSSNVPLVGALNGIRTGEIVELLSKTWLKNDTRLQKHSGAIAKPFEGYYQDSGKNVWRNPLNTQKGISCFAPDDIINNLSFLDENRKLCSHRLQNNYCEYVQDTTCNPYEYPKLLQQVRTSTHRHAYRRTTWTTKSILYLFHDGENSPKVPLVPIISAIYFGASREVTKGRTEVRVEDFKKEFNLNDDEFSTLFDFSQSGGRFDLLPLTAIKEKPIESVRDIETEISDSEIEALVNAKDRTTDTRKKEKIYSVDEIKLEQANEQHKATLWRMVKYLQTRGLPSLRIGRTDLVTHTDNEVWLFEVKSITEENERKQTRTGIGQLFDYEFIELEKYRQSHTIKKALVFERKPDIQIIEWVKFVGISVFWLSDKKDVTGEEGSVKELNELMQKEKTSLIETEAHEREERKGDLEDFFI